MKTKETLQLEQSLYRYLNNGHNFICFEVGIENEIVDCLSYQKDKDWRCYELKVSVSDFHSKQAKTFVGNFNYFVMPKALVEQVKNEIPDYIGIIEDGYRVVKNPKRQELKVTESILYYSLFKSLYRDAEKYHKIQESNDIDSMERLRKQKNEEIKELKAKCENSENKYKWMSNRFSETYQKFRFLQKRAKPEDIEEMNKEDLDDYK